MLVHELTTDECFDTLARLGVGHLACALDGQPYVVPVFFYVDPESRDLFSFSAVGQKIRWMRQNPKVCLTAQNVVDRHQWTTVIAFGRYDEVRADAAADLRTRARRLFEQRPSWWLPAVATVGDGPEPEAAVVFRIHVDRVTGRRTAR